MNNNNNKSRAKSAYKTVKNARNNAKNEVNLYNRGGLNGTRKVKNSRGFFGKMFNLGKPTLYKKGNNYYKAQKRKGNRNETLKSVNNNFKKYVANHPKEVLNEERNISRARSELEQAERMVGFLDKEIKELRDLLYEHYGENIPAETLEKFKKDMEGRKRRVEIAKAKLEELTKRY